MAKAIKPEQIPTLPEGASGWRRSPRRGSVFHAHSLGTPICGAGVYLDRNESLPMTDLGVAQYWGVCPRCFAKGGN